jgi:Ca2+-binding EF-hand superfamily protein
MHAEPLMTKCSSPDEFVRLRVAFDSFDEGKTGIMRVAHLSRLFSEIGFNRGFAPIVVDIFGLAQKNGLRFEGFVESMEARGGFEVVSWFGMNSRGFRSC